MKTAVYHWHFEVMCTEYEDDENTLIFTSSVISKLLMK